MAQHFVRVHRAASRFLQVSRRVFAMLLVMLCVSSLSISEALAKRYRSFAAKQAFRQAHISSKNYPH